MSPERDQRRKFVKIIIGSIFGFESTAQAFATPNGKTLSDLEKLAKQYCVSLPDSVRVLSRDQIDHTYWIRIPRKLRASSGHVFRIIQGDTVRLILSSPHPGAVGIHGLSDIVPLRPSQEVEISFRAAYKGRFPVHFHGIDGAHLEVGMCVVA